MFHRATVIITILKSIHNHLLKKTTRQLILTYFGQSLAWNRAYFLQAFPKTIILVVPKSFDKVH